MVRVDSGVITKVRAVVAEFRGAGSGGGERDDGSGARAARAAKGAVTEDPLG